MKRKFEEIEEIHQETEATEVKETVVSFVMSFERYLDVYVPNFDKYKKAYIGSSFRGQTMTKEEWDDVIAKNS